MVGGDGVGDVLQHHRLAALRARHQQAALALADRRDDVDQRPVRFSSPLDVALELQRLVGEQRRQVLEQDLVLGGSGGSPLTLSTLTSAK
jgi:Fe-S-cluster formation regulator IscX/YfhJ